MVLFCRLPQAMHGPLSNYGWQNKSICCMKKPATQREARMEATKLSFSLLLLPYYKKDCLCTAGTVDAIVQMKCSFIIRFFFLDLIQKQFDLVDEENLYKNGLLL